MIREGRIHERAGRSGIRILLLALALLLGAAGPARADDCSEYGGVLDGAAGTVPPSQLQIDTNCTIRNYPASNPLRTNFSFLTQPGQTDERWLIIFDNVVHTGQMACNAVAGHKIWFVNGSSSSIQEGCQNLLIPVEKIEKDVPPGQTTAAIGVPFTYTLTIPVLFDSATGVVIDQQGSPNDLHSVTVIDDLGETGVDLTYLGHTATWEGTGGSVSHTFSNVGGVLTFDLFPIVPAGDQILLEITVVLEDTPANTPGTQFVNTARWDFGRLIDGVFYEPLPGEWGISPPLTIAGPELVMTKTGPATLGRTLNLGEWGEFALDVRNTGIGDAWTPILLDRLPDGPTGGMCDQVPELLAAQVFQADGTTPVPGKGPLVEGTDFLLDYTGAPACELRLEVLTAAGAIGQDERLIVTYRTRLDADSQDGAQLTNVAGAVEWSNGDPVNPDRLVFTRTLTDGTVGTVDHEDAHTVTVALFGYFFEKSVANLTSGADPAATAAPGDRLRYTLRLQTTDVALDSLVFHDELGLLNAFPAFVPGSLALVPASLPPGADASGTDPSGGPGGQGILDVAGLVAPANGEIRLQFDVTLASGLADGAVVLNQADLIRGVKIADSDDPNINGQSDPSVDGDEDPTRVVIEVAPPEALAKANTQATAAVGEPFRYRITVPEAPVAYPMYDVRILDDLTASAADLRFLSVSRVSGSQPWTPVNTGTDTRLVIEDPAGGIDVPAGEQIVVEIEVVLEDTPTNVTGLTFTNTADYSFDLVDGDVGSQRPGDPGTTEPMTIVGPDQLTLEKGGPATMNLGTPAVFTLDVHNPSTGAAWNLEITDRLPDTPAGGTCDAAPTQVNARVFEADGTTPVSPQLVAGTDFDVAFSGAPDCEMVVTLLSPAAVIGPDQRLLVSYEAQLDSDSQDGAVLTNVAGATRWFGADGSNPETADDRREYTRTLTDGTVGVLDHEDAHTVVLALPLLRFEKTVANVTRGEDPATGASPGDRLRYRVVVENVGTDSLDDFDLYDELDRLNAPAAFQPGTLTLVTVPAGADASNSSSTGGASGTGVLDVRGLSLPGANDSAVVEFEITLAPVIANGTVVANQAELRIVDTPFARSDDPNVNGPADPQLPDDDDPTVVPVQSAPAFRVEKVSDDLSGDPNLLLAGETLRYTITVKNVGTDHATDATLRDEIPASTTYVAGSTTLNGSPVADGAGGAPPLSAGIALHAPEDPTPGAMRADASATPDNLATLTFDVVVDPGAVDGTVISNQAFVSAPTGGVSDQPSDDPGTPIPDDPTRDVVGALPLLFAAKDVALQVDQGTPGIVDPGDVLRYTITVTNSGNVAATGVTAVDAVPPDTTYLADSTTLNGLAVGQPDGGAAPLAAGLGLASSDLTPPLPGPAGGTLTPGGSAVLRFDVRVDAGTPAGTIIANQAVVAADDLPDLLSDGDGNPATGPEPTVVVVGAAQQLSITKQVAVVGGGPALAGSTLEYTVRVTNIASVPAFAVVITDDLDADSPGWLAYVAGSATLDGSAAAVTVAGSLLTASYTGPLAPGASAVLRFRAVIDPGLAPGSRVTNTGVVRWNSPPQTESASVSIDVGAVPGVGALSGTVWHDADFDDQLGVGERTLAGWIVELLRNDQPIQSVTTDAAGAWRIAGVAPNGTSGDRYALRFRAPDAGLRSALLGRASSPFTDGLQRIDDVAVISGSNLVDLDLPLDPNGVVYDALQRIPVSGATLTLLNGSGSAAVPPSCFDDPTQQGQITRGDGYYKFDLDFSDAACPSGGSYLIQVTVPGSGFVAGTSGLIPPTSGAGTPPLSVPACPGTAADALPAPAGYCESQPSELAPPPSVAARSAGTAYHLHLVLDGSRGPGSSQIFNNHLPVDPVLGDSFGITKTTPSLHVSRGALVPYEITLRNDLTVDLTDVELVDRFPAGFRYVEGSARIEGVPAEPVRNGRELVWSDLTVRGAGRTTLALLLAVGAGVSEGEYVNRAQARSALTGEPLSGEASATVRVAPDPTFSCTDVMGKVFADANRNGIQDRGERGLPGVRLVTTRGLVATTDAHGRYHITCAALPHERRGSNFALKLDDRTLPSGYRLSTRRIQVKRATEGKALRFNYAASIHRVVGLDMADPVFEPGTTEMRPQWRPRLDLLLAELERGPAILRLSYVADLEEEALVERRLESVKREIRAAWEGREAYELTIEPEIFWRRGAPVERPRVQTPAPQAEGR